MGSSVDIVGGDGGWCLGNEKGLLERNESDGELLRDDFGCNILTTTCIRWEQLLPMLPGELPSVGEVIC